MASSTYTSSVLYSASTVNNAATAKLSDGLSIQIRPAPVAKRVIAYLIDLSLVIALLYLSIFIAAFVLVVVTGVIQAAGITTIPDWVAGLVMGILFIVLFLAIFHGYFWYCEYKYGATIGKRAFGLKVTTLSGGRVSLFQCIVRDLARYIDCFLLFPGIFCIALTSRRRRLGDLMVNTMVTYSQRAATDRNYMYLPRDRYLELRTRVAMKAIGKKEAKTVLKYTFAGLVLKKGRNEAIEADLLATIGSSLWDTERAKEVSRDDLIKLLAEHCNQLSFN